MGPNLPKPQFFISNSDAITLVDNFGAYGLISGKVLSIGEAGPWTYLNFGKNYLNDFTVRVTKTAVKQLRRRGIDIQQVPGHHVQVRGILKSRDGPLIDLFDSTQLTVEANFNSEQPAVSKP